MENYIISEKEREILVAYQGYSEAALQYLAGIGAFRPRVSEAALTQLQAAMQVLLKRLLAVAVTKNANGKLTMTLPARGRIARSKIIDCPRYAVGQGPTAMFVKNGQRGLITNFAEILVEHQVEIDADGRGLPVLFGDLLPFDLSYKL